MPPPHPRRSGCTASRTRGSTRIRIEIHQPQATGGRCGAGAPGGSSWRAIIAQKHMQSVVARPRSGSPQSWSFKKPRRLLPGRRPPPPPGGPRRRRPPPLRPPPPARSPGPPPPAQCRRWRPRQMQMQMQRMPRPRRRPRRLQNGSRRPRCAAARRWRPQRKRLQ